MNCHAFSPGNERFDRLSPEKRTNQMFHRYVSIFGTLFVVHRYFLMDNMFNVRSTGMNGRMHMHMQSPELSHSSTLHIAKLHFPSTMLDDFKQKNEHVPSTEIFLFIKKGHQNIFRKDFNTLANICQYVVKLQWNNYNKALVSDICANYYI